MVSAENKVTKTSLWHARLYFEHKLPVREANEFKIIQWNTDFSNLESKLKFGSKNGWFQKVGVNIQCSTGERKTTFSSAS